jgi:hypothetical protein
MPHRTRNVLRLGLAGGSLLVISIPLLILPSAADAHGGGAAPSGGAATGQVIFGTIGSLALLGAMVAVVAAHRSGRLPALGRAADAAGRASGVPGWAALPGAVIAASLLIAVFGMYWDISTHLDSGRDDGPFANASHYFILAGLFGILFAGLLAIGLPKGRPSATALRVRGDWYAPLGGALIVICAAIALSAFPLDDLWHRIFGQDVTLWGPTHLLLFGGAALSVIGAWVLWVEGRRAGGRESGERPALARVRQAALAGGLLVALSTFQGEFDFAVPQFQLVFHPILLMLAAGITLVTARMAIGRGGALLAVAGFLVIRGVLTLLVSPTFGHTTLHFPLYLVEALVVEAVALRVPRERPLALGAIAGAGIGTIGLAAEWGWSHLWMEIPWPTELLPEGAITGFVAAVAGGVIGAFVGRALLPPDVSARRLPGSAVAAAAVAVVAVVAYALPISSGDPLRAQVSLRELTAPPEREVAATVRLDPPDAADDAKWLNITAWQGGGSVVDPLREVAPGVYESTQPIPVHPDWKTTLRLHQGTSLQGMPIYFPRDEAIPAPEIPAETQFTREFVEDKELLLREQKAGVAGAVSLVAYLSVLVIGLGLAAVLALGLRRIDRDAERLRAKAAGATSPA